MSAHFLWVHKLCSSHDFPFSYYVLLVQGMKNGINKTITDEDCKFDQVLGIGLAREIANMIHSRFSMDGSDPEGWKMGLLHRHHIWCFLCDPFNYEQWRSIFKIEGTLNRHALNMVESTSSLWTMVELPHPAKGTKEFDVRYILFYLCVVLNLNTNIINYFSRDFYSHTGEWANMWS